MTTTNTMTTTLATNNSNSTFTQEDIPSLLSQYSLYLSSLSKASNTISSYLFHVSEYISFNNNSPYISRQSIQSYKSYILNTKHNSSLTHNAKLAALISFNEFLIDSNLQESMAIIAKDKINIQKSTLSPCKIEDAQVYKFLEKIKTKESYRNYAIIYTLAYTGLRISECLNIKLSNIDYTEGILHVIRGKGNKDRDVTLTDDVIAILKEYISTYRPNVDSDYLFISRNKSNNYKLTTQAIENVFNKYTTIMTPHTMRHFRANDLVKNSGLMIGQIAEEMGHSNIQTTIGYTYNTASEKREKLNKMKKVG